MTKKKVLTGVLCLGLLAMANVCMADALNFDAHFFSWPTSFGSFAPRNGDVTPNTTAPPFNSPFVAAGSDLAKLKLVAVGGTADGSSNVGLSINNISDVIWNDPLTTPFPQVLGGTFVLNFPCSALSTACTDISSGPAGQIGTVATYPIAYFDGIGYPLTGSFSTSSVTHPIFDPDEVKADGSGRVIYTQNEKNITVIKARVGTGSKNFTLKFGKISVFFGDDGAIDPVKGIQANYTLLDGAVVVDQGKAFFSVQ